MPLDPTFWTDTLVVVASDIVAWLPSLLGALLWLISGWLIARIVQFILAGLLYRLGVDRIAERAGAASFLQSTAAQSTASELLARVVYWIILLIFVLAAADSLGLEGLVDTLRAVVGYLPSVLAAALILLLGGLLARVTGDAVGAFAQQAGVTGGQALGQAVRYVMLIFVLILAMGQLGIETTLLTTVTTVLITATAFALALAFGIGSRDLARNIMAGMHAKEAFQPGQQIQIRHHTGRLVDIGTVKSTIQTEHGLLSLPNAALTEEELTIVAPTLGGGEGK